MNKSLIVIYNSMIYGGSTSSLVVFMDFVKNLGYSVDLLLFDHDGAKQKAIPNGINILNPLFKSPLSKRKKVFSWFLHGGIRKTIKLKHNYERDIKLNTVIRYVQFISSVPSLPIEYDIAIAYMEGFSHTYLHHHVRAKKKIAWIHTDPLKSKIVNPLVLEEWRNIENLVFVSLENQKAFERVFPFFPSKNRTIENLIPIDRILFKANKTSYKSSKIIQLVTVARIDYTSKAFDRTLRLLAENKDSLPEWHWTIVGSGYHEPRLHEDITRLGLANFVTCLGAIDEPYDLMNKMDLFVLLSNFEGRPITVYESLIIGLPVLISEYDSAHTHIRHDIEGYIAPNNEEGIIEGLKVCLNQKTLRRYRHNLQDYKYDNKSILENIRKVFED